MVEAVKGAPAWSPWRPLAIRPAPDATVLAEILDGGQSFRWTRQCDGSWFGIWSEHAARVRAGREGTIEWSAPAALADSTGPALEAYFDGGRDMNALEDALPWRTDIHLARCMAGFPRLRVLRQPLEETLLCFLCSPVKRIPQIKQMVALLAERHGSPLRGAEPLGRRLPNWSEIAALSVADLRECRLGFRAPNIHATARRLAERPSWLPETAALPYPRCRDELAGLPGVGEKVADCVLLYGAGRFEAFPSDVWILRAMARHYGLEGWKPPAVAQFGRAHFGALAGLAQQYLFAYERRHA